MKQRYIRVLVYEGTPEWISEVQKQRGVKGSMLTKNGVIREAVVGDFLEIVDTPQQQQEES